MPATPIRAAKPAKPAGAAKPVRLAALKKGKGSGTYLGVVRARIDTKLKHDAEAVLEKLGLNGSDAIRLLYSQIVLSEGLPFAVKVPNAETKKAMRDIEEGRVIRSKSADEMFKKLGI